MISEFRTTSSAALPQSGGWPGLPRHWLALVALGLPLWCGCPRPAPTPPKADDSQAPAAALRLIVVDDPGLATAIERQWQATADTALELRRLTSEELVDPRRKRLAADAIIYPCGLIGELAERDFIVPISDEVVNGPELARRDILELIRGGEMVWGERIYAVPFGSPQLGLWYRRDLFEKLELQPPRSWAEYRELAQRLSDRQRLGDLAPAAGAEWAATVEPLGAGWASQVLLARAAGYARHRSYFFTLFDTQTMEPLIASPPFARALEELVAAAKFGPSDAQTMTPEDARRRLELGQCAMALTWPSRAGTLATETETKTKTAPAGHLGVAELPPSAEVFHPAEKKWSPRDKTDLGYVPLLSVAGRLGSVTKGAAQPQAALKLLLRLSGAEWCDQISPASPATTLYRLSHVREVNLWMSEATEPALAKQYAELVKQTQRRGLWLFSVRIPGRARYLAALDAAVYQALGGEKPAAECLQAAAAKWREITAELGLERQKAAYWRSLGQEP